MAKPMRPSLMSLSPQEGSKLQPIVGVSATDLHQGHVIDANAGSLVAEPQEPLPEPDAAQLHLNRAGWSEMSRLAQDLGMPLRDLMAEAFNDVLLKHQRPPVVEARAPGQEVASDLTLMVHASLRPLVWPILMGAWYWHQAVTLPLAAIWGSEGCQRLR